MFGWQNKWLLTLFPQQSTYEILTRRIVNSVNKIPRNVWIFGIVCLLIEVSSGIIYSLLPVFMVSNLGADLFFVGLVGGLSESASLFVRIFAGMWSDFLNRRKIFMVFGFVISTLVVPLFPLAHSLWIILAACVFDRLARGVRDAPMDSFISHAAPLKIRGASFGLRYALDTTGAFIGPLLAIGCLLLFSNDIRHVFWIAVIPAILSSFVVSFSVKENVKGNPKSLTAKNVNSYLNKIKNLGAAFWQLLFLGSVLAIARISCGFIVLKAQAVGLALLWLPLAIVILNIASAFTAYPAGVCSDALGRKKIIFSSIGFLILAEICLGWAHNVPLVMLGSCFFGFHLGSCLGLLSTMVADNTPEAVRGFGYGTFNIVCGFATILAGIVAGILGNHLGLNFIFYSSAAFSSVLLLVLLLMLWKGQIKFK